MAVRMALLVASVFVLTVVAAPAVTAAPGDTHHPLAYSAGGWKYREVANGAVAGFEATAFDDSGWSTGQAAFSNNHGGCPLTGNTQWNAHTDMLIRRTLTIPHSFTDLRIYAAADNNIQVWVNGVDVSGGMQAAPWCGVQDQFQWTVPAGVAHVGDNVLAVRGHDFGTATHLDVRAQYTEAAAPPPVPVPEAPAALLAGLGLLAVAGVAAMRRR